MWTDCRSSSTPSDDGRVEVAIAGAAGETAAVAKAIVSF